MNFRLLREKNVNIILKCRCGISAHILIATRNQGETKIAVTSTDYIVSYLVDLVEQ